MQIHKEWTENDTTNTFAVCDRLRNAENMGAECQFEFGFSFTFFSALTIEVAIVSNCVYSFLWTTHNSMDIMGAKKYGLHYIYRSANGENTNAKKWKKKNRKALIQ